MSRAADRLWSELAEPLTRPSPLTDARTLLSDAQRRVWDDPSQVKALLCGRRAGKTWLLAAMMLAGAAEGGLYTYLALTQRSARHIVWPALRDVAERIGLPFECLHEHTLTVDMPGGGRVVAAGTDDVRTIESWRGTKLAGAAVDEFGAQPNAWAAYLVRDILRPALVDLSGWLMLAGTPGHVCDPQSFWYQLTGPQRTARVPVHRWTILDNPHIPHAAAALEQIRLEHGWTEDSPSYRREWLAEWVDDVGALVFPLVLGLNTAERLPERNRAGGRLPSEQWRYTIGVDVGVVDDTAIAVVASHPLDDREWVVSVSKRPGMLVTELRDELRRLRMQYGPSAPIVIDSGGMGRYHAEELRRAWAMPVEAAEKTHKRSIVRDVRERLLAGRLVVLDGPECDALREEWAVLGWDDKRELPEGVDHGSDATLYALRRSRHYTESVLPDEFRPPVGTPDWHELAERKRVDRLLADAKRRSVGNGRPPWDA